MRLRNVSNFGGDRMELECGARIVSKDLDIWSMGFVRFPIGGLV